MSHWRSLLYLVLALVLPTSSPAPQIQGQPVGVIYSLNSSSYDGMTKYSNGQMLNGLNGANVSHLGANWHKSLYVDRQNYIGLLAFDQMGLPYSTYVNGDGVPGLNGGQNWSGPYVGGAGAAVLVIGNLSRQPGIWQTFPFSVGFATIPQVSPNTCVSDRTVFYTTDGSDPHSSPTTQHTKSIDVCGDPGIAMFDGITLTAFYSNSVLHTGLMITNYASAGVNWSNNVVANGGANPALASVVAINTWYSGLIADGIEVDVSMSSGLIAAANVFAPDSLIASLTPVIYAAGNQPWINHAFVSGDLSVNGLAGNGSTKYLDIGSADSTVWASVNNMGVSSYAYVAANESAYNGTTITVDNNTGALLRPNNATVSRWDSYDGGITGTGIGNGFYSGNRTGAGATALYAASSGHAWAAVVTGAGAPNHALTGRGLYCFELNNGGAPFGGLFSASTLSYFSVHAGFTTSQGQAEFNRTQTLRASFGGGFR